MSRGRAVALAAVLAVVGLGAWIWGTAEPPAGRGAAAKKTGRGATPASAGVEVGGGSYGVARRSDVDRSGVGTVRGRVVDEDGSPVTEGRVILHCLAQGAEQSAPIEGGAVEIGPEGEFAGPGCRGIVCAELRHATLLPREPWVLGPGQPPAVLAARPLERIVGQVTDGEGQAIAGAQIIVRRGGDGDDDPAALPPFTSRSTVSDGEGFFNFARVERPPCDPCGEASGRCEPGDARDVPTYSALVLVARAPGFRSVEKTVELGEPEPWQIVLVPPLAPLTGTVTDGEGRAYPRARVLARSRARGYEIHQARVDAGRFSLAELGEGPYDLRAVQDGVELAAAPGHVAGDAVSLVGQVPAIGRVVELEVVRSDTDEAITGAVVDGGPFVGARTDAAGVARAADVLPGSYALGIRVAGLRSQRRELTVPEGGEGPLAVRVEVVAH